MKQKRHKQIRALKRQWPSIADEANKRSSEEDDHARKTAKDGREKHVRVNGRPLTFYDGIYWSSLIFIDSVVVRPARFIGLTKTKRPRRASGTVPWHNIDVTVLCELNEIKVATSWTSVQARSAHFVLRERKFSQRRAAPSANFHFLEI